MVSRFTRLVLICPRKVGMLEGETGEERFEHFMRQLNEDHELRMEFFGNYPVLSRLMTESMQNTLDVTVELIQRFVKDHESIKYQFGNRLHRFRSSPVSPSSIPTFLAMLTSRITHFISIE